MFQSFLAFNQNALNNFIYLCTTNFWFLFLLVAVVGTIVLSLKDQIDNSVREEQNIL